MVWEVKLDILETIVMRAEKVMKYEFTMTYRET